MTSFRRNAALLKRKELKEAGEIISGYLKYPARLMIKKPGTSRDQPYEQYEDFSKLEFAPAPREAGDDDNDQELD